MFVDEITTLAGKFVDRSALQEHSNGLFLKLSASMQRVQDLEEEVRHLKTLLECGVSLLKPVDVIEIINSPEKEIARTQIELLRQRQSNGMELSLEDTKRFEIFVKVIKLIDGSAPKQQKTMEFKDISEAKLIAMASEPTPNDK